MLISSSFWRRSPLRFKLVFIAIVLGVTYLIYRRATVRGYHTYNDAAPYSFASKGYPDPKADESTACLNFPRAVFQNEFQIILKTGAGEVYTKLPAWLESVGRCIPDLLIFADFEDTLRGHQIYDCLGKQKASIQSDYETFKTYYEIQASWPNRTAIESIRGGWKLDKYKFIPMTELTYSMRPRKKWFLFIETDTYVFWDNMIRFINHLDHRKPQIMGSPVWRKENPLPFLHGGSGLLVSQAGMKKFATGNDKHGEPGTHQMSLPQVQSDPLGDSLLEAAMRAKGVKMRGYWPMFNGENIYSNRYGTKGDAEMWCEPQLTMHHLKPKEMTEALTFEQNVRNVKRPIIFRDTFAYIKSQLRSVKPDWNNLAEGSSYHAPHQATKSIEACLAACKKAPKCYQVTLHQNECVLGDTIRLGYAADELENAEKQSESRWWSAWNLDRIEKFHRKSSDCRKARWLYPNP